jgi:hypothetical protein
MVIFVGDRPSLRNIDPEVAFIGTPSHKNLMKWIDAMNIGECIMINSHTHDDVVRICQYYNGGGNAFVALGDIAARRLKELSLSFFKLPHPSPKNRLLNNSSFIDSELRKCYLYLKEHGACVKFVKIGNLQK